MKRTRRFETIALLVCLLSLGAAGPSWSASARSKLVLVVPHRVLFTVAGPIYIAQEKGVFRENNIDVDAVFTRGGGETVQAVVSGDARIGLSTGIFPVIGAFVRKAPVKIANHEFAAKKRDAMRGFFRAHQRAVEYMMDHKEDSAKIWVKKAQLKLPESAVLKTWDFYHKAALAPKPIRGIAQTMEDAVKFNFLKQKLTQAEVDQLIDLSYLP